MTDVQHIYQGNGDPNGVVVAAAGSHYIDLDNGDGAWVATWSEGGATGWVYLERNWPAAEAGGDMSFTQPAVADGLIAVGDKIRILYEGAVYSSVAFDGAGASRTYTAASDAYFASKLTSAGDMIITVTLMVVSGLPEA